MPRPGSQHFQNTQSAPEEDSFSQFSQQSHISQGSLEDHVNKCIIQILSDNFTLRSFKKCDILRGAKVKGRASKNILDEIKKKLFDVTRLLLLFSFYYLQTSNVYQIVICNIFFVRYVVLRLKNLTTNIF